MNVSRIKEVDVVLASQGWLLFCTGSMPHLSTFIVTDQKEKKMTGYSKKKKKEHASAAPCRDGKVTAGQYSSAPDTKGTHMRMQTMTPDIGDGGRCNP